MTPRQAALIAVAATTTVVGGFCAWYLRPLPDAKILARFPSALAAMIVAEDFRALEQRLAPDFTWRGAVPLDRAGAVNALREAVAGKAFFPAVADVAAVRADVDRFRLVVYGCVIEGDPQKRRDPPVRAFRLEALVRVDGRDFTVLEASIP
jgi:hypothetical protein